MKNFETQAVNGETRATDYPIYPDQCGALTPVDATDQDGYWNQGQIFYQIITENDGNLTIEGKDGNPLFFPNVTAGVPVVGVGRRILNGATIDGVDVTTTVTGNFWVYGGI